MNREKSDAQWAAFQALPRELQLEMSEGIFCYIWGFIEYSPGSDVSEEFGAQIALRLPQYQNLAKKGYKP